MENKAGLEKLDGKRLVGKITKIKDITRKQKQRMFELLSLYFDNVSEANFLNDLGEKNWVIILYDKSDGMIQGFSTQQLIGIEIDGVSIKALFSGDTIIAKEYWGTRELPRVWGHLAMDLLEKVKPSKLYWFYISKGYMTYLLMPRYLYKFYPWYDKKIPALEKNIRDKLASEKFGSQYNSVTGIVDIHQNYFLKKNIGRITPALLANPHINFFAKANPHYYIGHELACLAEIKKENLKPIFIKILDQK